VVASGETQIFGAAPDQEGDQTRFSAAPRPPPVRFTVENPPNMRRGAPAPGNLDGTRLLALAEEPRDKRASEPTRVIDQGEQSQSARRKGGAMEATRVMARTEVVEPSRHPRPRPRPEPRGGQGERSRSEPSDRGTQESGGSSRSAARLSQPRFGRESVLVWLSTAVAIVLVMLAYWLSGQLNPSAKLLIDVAPKSAELVVNSKRMGPIAGHTGFEIAPGDVLVEVRAPGHCSWFRHLKLSAKETFSTRVTLQQKSDGTSCP
jgi:hypothetical protein